MSMIKNLPSSVPPLPWYRRIPDPGRLLRLRAVPPLLILLFVLLAFGADLAWPSRKSYFATYTCDFKNFTVLHPVFAGSFFAPGGGGQEPYSVVYMALLRCIYFLLPHRLVAMRVLSVTAAVVALFLLYRVARRIISPSAAAVLLFLLATSPIYVESMRAYGYQSLSHLAVILTVYFTLSSRRSAGTAAAAAVCAFSTLVLYVTARPAAAFPVLYYLLDGKRSWKRLLIYLAVFTALVAGAGLAEKGSLAYPWRYFSSPEEQAGIWPVAEGRINWSDLREHTSRNLELAADYLLGLGRRPFADRESSSRLFNAVYVPFFLLGLIALWTRGRPGRNTILIMLLLFFILPLGSREIQPRRILMSIYPIYLLIVLGMGLVWRLISRYRVPIGVPALAALLAVGSWDSYEFIFRVARPRLNYSRSELSAVARFVEQTWTEVFHIRYYKEIDELIMGNPYFIPRPEKLTGCANIFAEESRDPRRTLQIFSSAVGEDLIYLYTDPPLRIDPGTLRWAEAKFGDLFRQGRVQGTNNLFYLQADFSGISPNLVFKADEFMRFKVRGLILPERHNQEIAGWLERGALPELFDGDSETFVLIRPDQTGGPVAIDFGLGEMVQTPVRSVSFRVPKGRGADSFRRLTVSAGPDAIEWEEIARFNLSSHPRGGEWMNFEFDNPQPRRFYRLEFPGGSWTSETGPLAFGGIWMFDRAERNRKIETVLSD